MRQGRGQSAVPRAQLILNLPGKCGVGMIMGWEWGVPEWEQGLAQLAGRL